MDTADPRHGTNAGAVQHWRDREQSCDACRLAANRFDKEVRVDRDRGRPRTVALGPKAWQVIASQTRSRLSAATGITQQKLGMYHQAGPTIRVHRTTRDRILAAEAPAYTTIGIRRRLQALAAMGWATKDVADACGLSVDGVKRNRTREARFVRDEIAAAIAAAYESMSLRLPTTRSAHAANMASRLGWAPPFCWDDIDADPEPTWGGPDTDIDPVVVMRLLQGDTVPSTKAEKEAAMAQWIENGGSQAELCRAHGWKQGRYGRLTLVEDGAA